MTEQAAHSFGLNNFGHAVSAIILAIISGLTARSTDFGPVITTIASGLGAASGWLLHQFYCRYLSILGSGGKGKGSLERAAYEELRESLAEGGIIARFYTSRTERFLDWVDVIFGDRGMIDRTLCPRAFWLKNPAPLWTLPGFDRCLLYALTYPMISIFVIWFVSGNVGPAEAALHLNPNYSLLERGIALVSVAVLTFLIWSSTRTSWKNFFLWITAAIALEIVNSAVNAGASASVAAGVVAGPIALALAGYAPVAGAVAVAVAIFSAFAGAFGGSAWGAYWAVLGAAFGVVTGIGLARFIYVKPQQQRIFYPIYFLAMIFACLCGAYLMSTLDGWDSVGGPLLLFLGFLTLLNAPFDWVSVGLTRALLRRGLELKGWFPLFLAILDAVLAAFIIMFLALVMVIGVQAFNDLAVYGRGNAVLPLEPLFKDIAANPTAAEYWWIYALLFSTVIPSVFNLVIGGASVVRGIPKLAPYLQSKMPVGKAVPGFDRKLIAFALLAQEVVGIILGVFAQGAILGAFFLIVLPLFGTNLLRMCVDVAAHNWPAWVWLHLTGNF